MTERLVPADLDLRDFQYMPLDVVRLVDSDLTAISTGDEFKAAVTLWCKAWHQVPAASLPDDDRMLAHLAGFGRDVKAWKQVRDVALRGFERHDDGRLYHPVIVEKALDAAEAKRKQRDRTSAATNARKARKKQTDDPRDDERNDDRDEQRDDDRDDTHNADRNVDQGKREGREERGKGKRERERMDVARASEADIREGDPPHWAEAQALLADTSGLSDFEVDFLHSIKWRPELTKAQRETLSGIQGKATAKGATPLALPTVQRGTPEFTAWIAHYRAQGKRTTFYEAQEAITVPSVWPPGHGVAA